MSAVENGYELIQNKNNKIVARKYSSSLRSMTANVCWPPFAQLYPPLVSNLGMERGTLGLAKYGWSFGQASVREGPEVKEIKDICELL